MAFLHLCLNENNVYNDLWDMHISSNWRSMNQILKFDIFFTPWSLIWVAVQKRLFGLFQPADWKGPIKRYIFNKLFLKFLRQFLLTFFLLYFMVTLENIFLNYKLVQYLNTELGERKQRIFEVGSKQHFFR